MEDERVEVTIVMFMMAIVVMVVTALRKSRGLILLMRHGLLLPMGDDDGQWKCWMMDS